LGADTLHSALLLRVTSKTTTAGYQTVAALPISRSVPSGRFCHIQAGIFTLSEDTCAISTNMLPISIIVAAFVERRNGYDYESK